MWEEIVLSAYSALRRRKNGQLTGDYVLVDPWWMLSLLMLLGAALACWWLVWLLVYAASRPSPAVNGMLYVTAIPIAIGSVLLFGFVDVAFVDFLAGIFRWRNFEVRLIPIIPFAIYVSAFIVTLELAVRRGRLAAPRI